MPDKDKVCKEVRDYLTERKCAKCGTDYRFKCENCIDCTVKVMVDKGYRDVTDLKSKVIVAFAKAYVGIASPDEVVKLFDEVIDEL